jgi:polysaccharide deacetylase family protein (PEP-CTERM system associated)
MPDDSRGRELLLSVDFEDWHQLVRRRVGVADWERPGPALERQTDALLELFDDLGVRATFFVLGLAARSHPGLVERIARQGHEIGCHGDRHTPVHTQTPADFAEDLRRARETIADVAGSGPLGYRAPAFSITRDSAWAFEVLAEQGFAYDSSQHDSPRLRGRIRQASAQAHPVPLRTGSIWEFPIAVWHAPPGPVPVGGASYWALLPTRTILHGLEKAGPRAGLYLHPQEVDPQRLDPQLPTGATPSQRAHGVVRGLQRNLARRRTAKVLQAIAETHPLITYGEAYARLTNGTPAGVSGAADD